MNRIITLIATIFLFTTIANATVWRVNNRPYVDADFTTLQAAIDGASAGDTLYLGGSTTTYGDGIFDKQLVVIGPGYWLDENDTTQAYNENAEVRRLTFNAGSEGSLIEGLYIYYSSNAGHDLITINVDNIELRKNNIYSRKTSYSTGNGIGILINGNRSNILIQQNMIIGYAEFNGGSRRAYSIHVTGILTNCIFSNNFIRSFGSYGYPSGSLYTIHFNTNDLLIDIIINNNIIWGSITTYHTFLVNNILVEGSYNNSVDDQTSNNLCNGTQFPNINNNVQNVDMSTVFEDYTKYIDNGYFLSSGSPAIGAGVNGGDCGVFSYDYGTMPYVLSGMPEIPAIFEANFSATVGTTTIPVNIKSTTHNENK